MIGRLVSCPLLAQSGGQLVLVRRGIGMIRSDYLGVCPGMQSFHTNTTCMYVCKYIYIYMGVSINGGTPKPLVSILNWTDFGWFGVPPILGNLHIISYHMMYIYHIISYHIISYHIISYHMMYIYIYIVIYIYTIYIYTWHNLRQYVSYDI